MSLQPSSELSPVIPPFDFDMDAAFAEIGYLSLQVRQLQGELVKRATETNELHDEVLRLREAVAQYVPEGI